MTKIETQLETMSSPVRPYLVRRNAGIHNTYPPVRVQVKFALACLGAVGVTIFIILCAAKAVPR